MIPLVGFLPADDPRVRGTDRRDRARAAARRLRAPLPHARDARRRPRRPARASSCRARSGSSTCSSCSAAHDEARALFERLLALRNDLGLLVRGVRPGGEAPARQLPAGVHARRRSSTRPSTSRTIGPMHAMHRRHAPVALITPCRSGAGGQRAGARHVRLVRRARARAGRARRARRRATLRLRSECS